MKLYLKRVFKNPALQHRNFHLLSLDAILNASGVAGERVILSLLVYQVGDSSFWVGLTLALYFTPMLFVGGPAGALADWMDRRLLLRMIELAIAVILGLFGLLVLLGITEIWYLLGITLVSGSFHALYQPVRSSYAYDIVGREHVVAGLSFLNIAKRIGQLLGALLAGSVMQRFGAENAYFVLSGVHIMAFLILTKLSQIQNSEKSEKPISLFQNLREYVKELRHNRTLLMLILVTASVEVFGFSFMTVLPEIATERIGVGAEGLGLLHAAEAIGGFGAGLALAGLGRRWRRGILFLLIIFGYCLSLLALALAPSLVLVLLALGTVAGMATSSDVLTQSMMQLNVRDRLRGRAMGVWSMAISAAPLGHLEMGALAGQLGTSMALGINAGILAVIAVLTYFLAPKLRQL
ncbi:MAG: MFS transporter [SAR324 cluster bacterium]|nr:MFS transporter [SAR324 cluster bacterium]